jgi:uncharacterized membrane protein YwaF
MKMLSKFLHDFFLAAGVIWFFCGLSIILFNYNYGEREIIMTLLFPLAWAVLKLFDKRTNQDSVQL